MRDDAFTLFNGPYLSERIRNLEQKMLAEVEAIEGNTLLNTSVDDLCDYLEDKYKLDVPQLSKADVNVDAGEAQFPMKDLFSEGSRYIYVPATSISFYIPFEGDQILLTCKPSSYSSDRPRAVVRPGEIVLTYTGVDQDASKVRSNFDRDLAVIDQHLGRVAREAEVYNAALRGNIRSRLEGRRSKLLRDQGLVANLGFPLRRRGNVPQTYTAPAIRRKPKIVRPTANSSSYIPEPELDMQEYEHILSVISNMVAVIERSPHVFRTMDEESLRHHFLIPLNGHYEGQATGETFNYEGKTDILIRAEGRNLFIAECKFWNGPESLMKALNQLLGYASWRDTKTALLIFNRERQFSTVLEKIPETLRAHPNYKRTLPYASETGFRVVMHHRDDINRELILTVLAFEVPS